MQSQPETILHVDDDPFARDATRLFLLQKGVTNVNSCASGDEALVLAPQIKPDLILLDVRMQGMGGRETLKRLSGLPELEETAIILLTACNEDQDVKDIEALGTLSKLLSPKLMWQQIKNLYSLHKNSNKELVNWGPSALINLDGMVPICVVEDAGPPTKCLPAMTLIKLFRDGQLTIFDRARVRPPDKGNCHRLASALMMDLMVNDCVENWRWCQGESDIIGDHSWLEIGQWAIDPSNCGEHKPIIIKDRKAYRTTINCIDVKRHNAQESFALQNQWKRPVA